MTKRRQRFTTEFKLEVISLVTDQSYSVRQAAEAMGVGHSIVDKWVRQYCHVKKY